MGPISELREAAGLSVETDGEGHWAVALQEHTVRVTNPDKVLWPATGFTKGRMIAYYVRISRYLMPHLADRPVTLGRAPDGVDNWYWYQTACPHPPEWISTRKVGTSETKPRTIDYCVVDGLASLIWVANLGAIELHPLVSRTGGEEEAEAVIFDLDPRPPAGMEECCRVALHLKRVLEDAGCDAVVKTSGLAGLHVYGVLPERTTFSHTRQMAKSTGAHLAEVLGGRVTLSKRLAEGAGRVLIDWSQNSPRRSMPAPYSLRIAREPTVSTPLQWDEVRGAIEEDRTNQLRFSPDEVLRRVEAFGDLFATGRRGD